MTVTTPALLFPAISLLLLAYTNRFLVIAQLIRNLHGKNSGKVQRIVEGQIANLRQRLRLIRAMQVVGVLSFLFCTIAMICLFLEATSIGIFFFGGSLILLCASLLISLYEIQISCVAIDLELADIYSESIKEEGLIEK